MNEEILIRCDNDLYKYDNKDIFDYIYNLQQENTQLKRMLNIKEKFDKKEVPYEWEFKDMFDMREENDTLKQQLKDKDEKISEIIEYIKENIKAELLNGSIWIDKYKLLNILESNKED